MGSRSEIDFDSFLQKLGSSIKRKREFAGITQEGMDSDPYGIDPRYLQRIENGRNITLRTLFKISKKLKIPIREFFDFEQINSQNS